LPKDSCRLTDSVVAPAQKGAPENVNAFGGPRAAPESIENCPLFRFRNRYETSVTWFGTLVSITLFFMPEGVQRYQRTKMVLPCRVWLDEQENTETSPLQLAHTLDISPIGGRLGGLRTPVEVGQSLTLQRGQRKTHVRVIWTKQLGPTEIQAGFETLEFGKKIWDVDLPQDAEALQAISHEDANAVDWEQPPVVETAPEAPRPAPARQMAPIMPPNVQMRWVAIAAALLVITSVGLFVQHKISTGSDVAVLQAPVPTPPTAEELAAMTPKPRKILPRVAAATPDSDSTRLKVAEAPQGRVAYPVAPDSSAKGKVDLKVVIAADGRVKQIQLRSGKQLLAQAAEQAIKFWRYSQHVINGEPVEAETNVTVSFLGDDAVSLHFPSSSSNIAVRPN
jgi:outer membrane biosynthesis protein TonB